MNIELIVKIANEFVNLEKPTVRKLEEKINYSKTTIHNCVTSHKLKEADKDLFDRCKKILETNKAERHLRGGKATAEKYKKLKELKK